MSDLIADPCTPLAMRFLEPVLSYCRKQIFHHSEVIKLKRLNNKRYNRIIEWRSDIMWKVVVYLIAVLPSTLVGWLALDGGQSGHGSLEKTFILLVFGFIGVVMGVAINHSDSHE